MISAILSLLPEKIAFSSVRQRSTASSISRVTGYISFVSIGIGSLRLKFMFIMGGGPLSVIY